MDERLVIRLREFVRDRDWNQFHSPKNLSMALASEVGELLSHFRWLTPAQSENVLRDKAVSAPILDELGDVGICLIMLCDRLGVSLSEVVARKIEVNEARYPIDKVYGRATPYRDL